MVNIAGNVKGLIVAGDAIIAKRGEKISRRSISITGNLTGVAN